MAPLELEPTAAWAGIVSAYTAKLILTELRGCTPFSPPAEVRPEVVLEREERRQQRELRRQCDRMRLEEALGWDADLIDRFLGA